MIDLVAVDFSAENAAQDFSRSLRETGFGVLKNHPISQQLVTKIYRDWQVFFNSAEKFDYAFNPQSQDGFFAATISETAKNHHIKDIKEYFHFYPWGQVPVTLQRDISNYYAAANHLAATLLGWVEDNTPAEIANKLSQPYSEMIKDSQQTLLRILHYPPITGSEALGAIRAAAHEDINLLTILPAATEPGLQVKAKDGNWLDVPGDFGNLVVNVGDMLQEASAGYYPSTTHRVINPGGETVNKSRISLPLFLHARPEVLLSERYSAKTYLHERLRELGVKT